MSSSARTICAACGKEEDSANLKKCGACLSVNYCSKECQATHRPQHKKACKERAAEIYDEKLFTDHPLPEECPICMLHIPLNVTQIQYQTCCGKRICHGCVYAMQMSEGKDLCAFCRTPPASSNNEDIKRLHKLMDCENAYSFFNYAGYYDGDYHGISQDHQKCIELLLKAGELGCTEAHFNLGDMYINGCGVEVDRKKAIYYWELAAMNGSVTARYNLGGNEYNSGDKVRGYRHFIIAARAGLKESLDAVKKGFMKGLVTKDEYASTLRAYHERQKETRSDARDKAAASGLFGRA